MNRATAILGKALDDLRTRCKVDLDDLLPEEIGELVRACDKAAEPFRGVNADAVGFPVKVCEGVYFWHLTIGASVWLDEVEDVIRGPRYRLALVYAVGNARDPKAFEGLDDERKIHRAVSRYCRRIPATPEEVNLALDILFRRKPDTRKPDVGRSAVSWANVCARLETQTGIPASEWMWERSGAYALKCYHDLSEFARAFRAGGGGSPGMQDELDEATNELQRLKVRIMKRVRGA